VNKSDVNDSVVSLRGFWWRRKLRANVVGVIEANLNDGCGVFLELFSFFLDLFNECYWQSERLPVGCL
jgi:hypothetical protein